MKRGGDEQQADCIVAPMPGKVVKVPVHEGDLLQAGSIAVVVEAMKMQSNFKVSTACRVKAVLVREGDSVSANQVMIKLDLTDK